MNRMFNSNALISIRIIDKQACLYLTYEPEKTKRFGKVIQECWVEVLPFDRHGYSRTEILSGKYGEDLTIENNTAYYLPYVKLTFLGKESTIKKFVTYQEAKTWAREIADKFLPIDRRIAL